MVFSPPPTSPSTPITPRSAALISNTWRASRQLNGAVGENGGGGAVARPLSRLRMAIAEGAEGCAGDVGTEAVTSNQQPPTLEAAGPLPTKAGEIGYQTSDGVPSHAPSGGSSSSCPAYPSSEIAIAPVSPASAISMSRGEGKHTLRSLFLVPTLVLCFNVGLSVALAIGLVALQLKARADSSNGPSEPFADTTPSNNSPNSKDLTPYMSSIIVVGMIIELWIISSCVRGLYHRAGLWLDSLYPEITDPTVVTAVILPPSTEARHPADDHQPSGNAAPAGLPSCPQIDRCTLPLWARVLRLEPTPARPALLPSYAAALGVIRGRNLGVTRGTGDPEDSEVLRTLAMGQGRAAPAFGGAEFRDSVIVLAGPHKEDRTAQAPAPAEIGLIRRLSSRARTVVVSMRRQSSTLSGRRDSQRRGEESSIEAGEDKKQAHDAGRAAEAPGLGEQSHRAVEEIV